MIETQTGFPTNHQSKITKPLKKNDVTKQSPHPNHLFVKKTKDCHHVVKNLDNVDHTRQSNIHGIKQRIR